MSAAKGANQLVEFAEEAPSGPLTRNAIMPPSESESLQSLLQDRVRLYIDRSRAEC